MCDILHLFPYKCFWLFAFLRVLWPKQSLVLAMEIETIFSCGSFYLLVIWMWVVLQKAQESSFWLWCLHLIFGSDGSTAWQCWRKSSAHWNMIAKGTEICALGLRPQWSKSPKPSCCLSKIKNFRQDISNKGTGLGNWCTKQYSVLWQSIMRIFCPGTVTVTTDQYFLVSRTAAHELSVWV